MVQEVDPLDVSGLVIILQIVAAVVPALPFLAILVALGRRTLTTRLILLALACGLLAAAASLAAEFGVVKLLESLAPQTPPDDVTLATVPIQALFLVMLVLAGLPEEAAKLLCLTQVLLRSRGAVRGRDAVLLGGLVGLSFGTIENLTTTILSPDWVLTAAARSVYAVPLHASMGLIGGAVVAASGRGPWARLAMALVIVAPLHAAVNTVIARIGTAGEEADPGPAVGGIVLMLLIWAIVSFRVRRGLQGLDHDKPVPGALSPGNAAWAMLFSGFASLVLALLAALLAAGGVVGSMVHDQADLIFVPAALLPLAFLEIAAPLRPRRGPGGR